MMRIDCCGVLSIKTYKHNNIIVSVSVIAIRFTVNIENAKNDGAAIKRILLLYSYHYKLQYVTENKRWRPVRRT